MPRRRKRRRLARQTTTTKSQSAEEGEWSLSWEGQGITGMGRAPRLHGAMEPALGQGTICKAPQRTCNYSLALCAQDWGAATEGHQPQDSLLQCPRQRPYPEFTQTKQRARESLAGATHSSLQEGKSHSPHRAPQEHSRHQSLESPAYAPEPLQPAQTTPRPHPGHRCHRMGQV